MSDQNLEETLDQVNQPTEQPEETTSEQSQESAAQESANRDSTARESAAQESNKEKNFRELRDKVTRIERERNELAAHIKAQEQAKTVVDEDDIGIAPEDLVEGKHLKVYAKQLREMKKELDQYKQQSYEQSTEARLKAQYPDFEKVVSVEMLTKLREAYPEIAETINSAPNLYNKATAAYTIVKKLGLYIPENYEKDQTQVAANTNKPRSSQSVAPQQGESPISNANAFAQGLTPDLKNKLYKEMLDAKKRI